jgi:glutamine synthetase adenylyltransferase
MEGWTLLAEKTTELLSSYTQDGTMFSVHTHPRRRGREGELVTSEDAVVRYLAETAEVWEALPYLKAWPVAGNFSLGQRIISRLVGNRGDLFKRFAHYPSLEDEIHQIHSRSKNHTRPAVSNAEIASSGYCDVDYAVSFLRLRYAVALPPGTNTPEQIIALSRAGLLTDEDARALGEGAAFLRSVDHAARLVTGSADAGLPEHVGQADAVQDVARRWGLIAENESLAQRLSKVQQQVHFAYERLVRRG